MVAAHGKILQVSGRMRGSTALKDEQVLNIADRHRGVSPAFVPRSLLSQCRDRHVRPAQPVEIQKDRLSVLELEKMARPGSAG